jgi:hypothetical protein
MVSASGSPVVVFGSIRLPAIAPANFELYSVLRETHSVLAFFLVAVVAAHVSAVLLHSITLRDGMLAPPHALRLGSARAEFRSLDMVYLRAQRRMDMLGARRQVRVETVPATHENTERQPYP